MEELVPSEFYLSQNYPNPFKEKTVIKYCVAYKTRVQITVYDSKGKEIEKLVNEEKSPGTYEVEFSTCHSGESARGARDLPNGYYFYRMFAEDYSSEKKWFCINNLLRSNTMKSFLHTLFFFLLVTQMCFAQWVQVGLEDKTVKDIAAMNSNIFAITSDSGSVYRSTDNGINWLQIVESRVIDIEFALTGAVFMIRDSLFNGLNTPRQMFLSSDAGSTWNYVNIMEQLGIGGVPMNIKVSPAGTIFCGIFEFLGRWCGTWKISKSADNGLTWTTPGSEIIGGTSFDFRDNCIITIGSHVTMCGGHCDICSSSDEGSTWNFLGYSPRYHPFFYNVAIGAFSNGNILVGTPVNPLGITSGLYLSVDIFC